MAMLPIAPRVGFSSDLTNFVISPILIYDSQGNPATVFYLGSNYSFRITFRESGLLQFAYDQGVLTYQLPSQLRVQQSTVDHSPYPIYGDSMTPSGPRPVIGWYSIDIDGLIKVHFDEVDRYGNPALVFDEELQEYVLVNFIDYYSDALFTLDIAAQFRQTGSNQLIDFGNGVTVTVTVENPLSGTLAIAKTAVVSPIVDQSVQYTVTITAQNGPVHGITLNDFEEPGTNGLIRGGVFKDMTVSVIDGPPYIPPEFGALQGQLFGNGFSLSFPGVTLAPGEQIVVVFTLDMANVIRDWAAAHSGAAGIYSFDFRIYNRAVTQGLDEEGAPTPSAGANNSAQFVRQFFNKTGAQDLDHAYTARWTNWSIGDNVTPLNGATATDTLTGLLFGANNPLPNGENGVNVTFYDAARVAIANWYIPVAAGAGGFSFTLPAPEEIVVTGLRGDGIYVQAQGAHVGLPYGPIVRATVQPFWTTVANLSDFNVNDSNRYYNTITVDINGDHPSYTVGVTINRPGASPTITKTADFGGDASGPQYIEWTVEFYVPRACYGQSVSVIDDGIFYLYGFQGDTSGYPRRFGLINVPSYFLATVYSDNLGLRTLTRNVDFTLLDADNTNGYAQMNALATTWRMYFIGDTTGIPWSQLEANSLWPFSDDTWLTITYRTPLTAIIESGGVTMTLREAFERQTGVYANHCQNYVYGYNPISRLATPTEPYVAAVAGISWPFRKTATVSGDTMTYRIAIRSEYLAYDDVFTDVFDPKMEYVPFSLRIWKNNASSTFYGPYQMVGGVFTDMLSEAISGNTLSFDFLDMYRINWGPGGAEYYPNPTLLSDSGPASETYFIEYTLRLKEEPPAGEYTIANTASFHGFNSRWISEFGTHVVEKTMVAASNVATVTILINTEERTLAGGAGRYTVTDQMSDTLAIYLTTIIMEAWENGDWVVHSLTNSTSGDLWTYTATGSNQVSFVVPDGVMLRITYKALIKGQAGETVTIGNEVWVAGEYYDVVDESFYITDTNASATGTRTTVTVIKYDAQDPDVLLSDAIFALYIALAYPGWDTVRVPAGIERVIMVGATYFYYLASGATNINGRLVFDNQWLTPTHMAIYALKELRAPVGYESPVDPITLFSYTPYTDVEQISDTISIPDTKLANLSATIYGFKTVCGINPPDKIFTFRLTQVADASGTPLPNPYTDITTTLGQGGFGFPLTNLMPNTIYYFKITEDTDPADTNWIYDPQAATGQIVIVSVSADETVTVFYPNGGNEVEFTNIYSETPRCELADLSIQKTADRTTLEPGDPITYTLTVTNHGPDDVPTVTVYDAIPAELTGAEYSINNGLSWQPWNGSYTRGALANGASFILLIRAEASSAASGSILNTACVSGSIPDPNPCNNTAVVITTVTTQPPACEEADLSIQKTADRTTLEPGDPIAYTLTVTNHGPDDVPTVTVYDAIPAELTGAEYSINNGVSWHPWTSSYTHGALTNGSSFSLLIRATASLTASGCILNTACVSGSIPDPNPCNNTAAVITTVTTQPPACEEADLAIQKTADRTTLEPGDPITYTLTVTNHGPDDVPTVTVYDAIPAELTGAEYSINNGVSWHPWNGSYTHGALPNGASFILLIRAEVSSAASGSILNTACVSGSIPDPNPCNNTAAVITTVTTQPPACEEADLSIQKTADRAALEPGDPITYTLTVTNHGPDDAAQVVLADVLPNEMHTVQYSFDGQTWAPWGGPLQLGALPANASLTVLIRGIVHNCTSGRIANTAIVLSTTADPNPGNNHATVITRVTRNRGCCQGLACRPCCTCFQHCCPTRPPSPPAQRPCQSRPKQCARPKNFAFGDNQCILWKHCVRGGELNCHDRGVRQAQHRPGIYR